MMQFDPWKAKIDALVRKEATEQREYWVGVAMERLRAQGWPEETREAEARRMVEAVRRAVEG